MHGKGQRVYSRCEPKLSGISYVRIMFFSILMVWILPLSLRSRFNPVHA